MEKIWPLPTIEIISLNDIEESQPVALLTSPPAWEAVKNQLHLPVIWQAEVLDANLSGWQRLSDDLIKSTQPAPNAIYAVGGGLVADAAKYVAAALELPLTCVPTALTVDAFLTWASGIRQDGCVRYIETKPPDRLVVDIEFIASAPPHLRAAGICDVLSIATGLWDWHYADELGQNPPGMQYHPYAARIAESILSAALDCAEAAGCGDPAGLKQLLDCLALEVQLCNQLGHARAEEGSEHYFAYALENLIGAGHLHGELVGPGIMIIAELQGQAIAPLRKALEACHIPLDKLPAQIIQATLQDLPGYVRRFQLPYGIAHELNQ